MIQHFLGFAKTLFEIYSSPVISLEQVLINNKMAQSAVRDLLQIFKSCVSAVLPQNLIRQTVKYNPTSQKLTIVDCTYDLEKKNVYLAGTGKAVQDMAREIEEILNSKIKHGVVSIPQGSLSKCTNKRVQYFEGASNNLPDTNAVDTSIKIKEMAATLNHNDILLVLISGGGSALLPLPKLPVNLDEKTNLIKKLANSGADIKELNTVRKKLSDIKGGQLAIVAQPAKVISLILSDIVDDPIELIASGPTVQNTDDYLKALSIIKKYNLFHTLSESVKKILESKEEERQFPKNNVNNYIIGSNKLSIEAGVEEAKKLNYHPIELSSSVTGYLKDVAQKYAVLTKFYCELLEGKTDVDVTKNNIKLLKIPGLYTNNIQHTDNDVCLIFGGEITVKVKGKGQGGRNQQLALQFSKDINEFKKLSDNFEIYFLSAGTDGIDGPTDAAGAIGYLGLLANAGQENLDIEKFILENDSYNFYKEFEKGGYHVVTGHTGTNVMDIHLIVIKRKLK